MAASETEVSCSAAFIPARRYLSSSIDTVMFFTDSHYVKLQPERAWLAAAHHWLTFT